MSVEAHGPTIVRDLVISIFASNGKLVDTGNNLVRNAGLTAAWLQVLGASGCSPVPLPVAGSSATWA